MNAIARRAGAPAEPAAALEAFLASCVIAGVERRGWLLRLSDLPPAFARPHHRRLARDAVAPLLAADRARLFALANADLVIVWRGDATAAEAEVGSALAHLFADGDGDIDLDMLLSRVTLPSQADTLRAAIARSLARAAPRPPPPPGQPLDPASLARLEERLASADVARFARRKTVFERLADGRFVPRWERRFLSVDEIAQELAPGHAARADRWLFRRLTRTLDRRMLALLAAPTELRGAGPFSLDLNIASVLSPEFLRFDAALPIALRGHVILDLFAADILADAASFMLARDFVRPRGYRLLLRGIGVELCGVFPRARLGVDWLQLVWSDALARGDEAAVDVEPETVVLTGQLGPAALAWAGRRGIRLFQVPRSTPPDAE